VELMRIFIQSGYQHTKLGTLNRCQLFSWRIYLSELCNATGMKLEQHLWKAPHQRESSYTGPVMPKPTQTDWHLWQQALQNSLLLRRNLTLPILLSKWSTTMVNQPGWYYHPVENALYHWTEMETTWHGMYTRQSQSQAFHAMEEIVANTVLSHKLQKASVAPQGVKVILKGIGTSQNPTPTILLPWYTQLEQTTLGTGWQLRLNIQGETLQIREAILGGHSTGSVQWIISKPMWHVHVDNWRNQCDQQNWRIHGGTRKLGWPQHIQKWGSGTVQLTTHNVVFIKRRVYNRSPHGRLQWKVSVRLTEK